MEGEGTIEGRRWYWRLRHGEWSFGVGDTEEQAVAVAMGFEEGFRRDGEVRPQYDGDIPDAEAVKIIARCLAEYDAEQGCRPDAVVGG